MPLLALLVLTLAAPAWADDPLACGQKPGERFFWLEHGFCDAELRGPERAAGIVIYNHGLSSTIEQYRGRAPVMFRALHARGWDVIKLNRNNLGEGTKGAHQRAIDRVLEEVAARRTAGYRRVIVAGQSFGGLISLEAANATSDIFGVFVTAPGVRKSGAAGVVDLAAIDRLLRDAKVQRLGVAGTRAAPVRRPPCSTPRASRRSSKRPSCHRAVTSVPKPTSLREYARGCRHGRRAHAPARTDHSRARGTASSATRSSASAWSKGKRRGSCIRRSRLAPRAWCETRTSGTGALPR
jgi:pimeloyl-ACP methyl ester carboxylesterase